MLNYGFGRKCAGQTWEVRKRREVRDKEMQEKKEVHGRKGWLDGGSTLEEEPRASMLIRAFWEGKCGTKREVRGIEGGARGKGSTEIWSETPPKKQSLAGK